MTDAPATFKLRVVPHDPAQGVRWVGRDQHNNRRLVTNEADATPLTAVQVDAFLNRFRASLAQRQWRVEQVRQAPEAMQNGASQ